MAPPPESEARRPVLGVSGKEKASRIPLDYFKRSNYVERWKLWLTGLALLLSVGWWASGWVSSDQGQMRYSRGPVADVHATWETECTVCHTPFMPIDAQNWATLFLGTPPGAAERCTNCHAGPPHQATQKLESTPSCAGCHHDHRGRHASLIRVADSDCTRCHQDLRQHMTSGEPAVENTVTRFAKGTHPQFSILRDRESDPGKLKFNHQLHMTVGLTANFTLANLSAADRDRYRHFPDQKDNTPVKLECASCHQTDSGDFKLTGEQRAAIPAGVLTKRARGAYMLPITYENQCRACHPLTFDKDAPNLAVPHGLQPEAVTSFLWGVYGSEYVKKRPELAPPATALTPPLPGKELFAEEKKARDEIKAQVAAAEKFLYRDRLEEAQKKVFGAHKMTCGECHDYQLQAGAVVPKQIEAPQIPEVWFKHSFFNHAAHRAVRCVDCHTRADPGATDASTESKDVLMPGIDTCLECHSPRQGSGDKVSGGARMDCVECHQYHHGTKEGSLQGIGAAARAPKETMDLKQFLSGKLK